VFVYFGLGIYMLFFDGFNIPDPNLKITFSIFFFAYGAFRGVRWLQKNKARKYYEAEDYEQVL